MSPGLRRIGACDGAAREAGARRSVKVWEVLLCFVDASDEAS
jgi:hypothetical protein